MSEGLPERPEADMDSTPDDTIQEDAGQDLPEGVVTPEGEPPARFAEALEEIADDIPVEIAEIDAVVSELRVIAATAKIVHEVSARSSERPRLQLRLQQYANSLGRLPRALQILHDIRRHVARIEQEAHQTRALLVANRDGDDDSLSSEEARIIVATATIKDVVLTTIHTLEGMLSHVRNTAHTLLTLISHPEPGFLAFAHESIGLLQVDHVLAVVTIEIDRMVQLRNDLLSLYELRLHAEEIGNV